ncbi:MAG: hypothetical protein K1X75_15790 [Leptospirales bacterium]|nr:hypothetical protein [Leptospirales bacterium]
MLGKWAARISAEAQRLTLIQVAFACLSLLTGILCIARWQEFDLDLMSPETIAIGSRSRLWFGAPALLGLLGVLADLRWRSRLYYIAAAIAAGLLATGFIRPDLVHAKVLKFQWTPWIYAYCVVLLLQASMARAALAVPLFQYQDLRERFFRRLG